MRHRISVLCVLWAVLAVGNSFAQDDVCENDVVIPDPDDHPELVEDCKILWAIKDELRGSASLKWAEDRRLMNWEGISITSVSPLRVWKIHLTWKGLDGRIPWELSKLSALKHLQLDNNKLIGRIPGELSKLQFLEHLQLNNNDDVPGRGLSGGIPTELSKLASLEYLRLDNNKLVGIIPEELSKLASLEYLNLDWNELDGPIPPELGRLSNLRRLDLSNNELTGSIPRELGDLSNLLLDNAGLDLLHEKGLDLDHNKLTGCVPRGLERFYNETGEDGPINVQLDPDTREETRLKLCRAPSLTLSIEPTKVREGDPRTDIQVTAMLDAETVFDATVHVVVGAGTATEGTDFTVAPPSFDISIVGGDTEGEKTFSLVVEDDFSAEGDETIAVSGSVDALSLSADTVYVTIEDDDAAPSSLSLRVDPAEVDEEGAPQPFTVTASFPAGSATLPQPTEVSLTVEDGTAVAGEDYKAVEPFTVTIPAGSTSGEEPFTLTVIDDEGVEPDETIEIGGTAAGFTVSSAEVTINDDDVAADEITLTVSPDTVTEGRAPQPFTVTASFPAGSATLPQPTEVSLTVEDGTAVAGEDYKAVEPFTVTIPAGSTSGEEPFTLTVIDDEGVEPDETIEIGGTATGFTVSSAEVTINDDDVAADEITLTVSPDTVTEGRAPQPFTVTASFPAGSATLPQPTEVSLTVEDGTAVAGEDYKAVEPFTVTIPAGSTSGEEPFTLTVIDDEGVEPDETIEIGGTATGFTVSSAEVTINDDDVAADEITLTVSPDTVTEGRAPQPFTVTASFPAGSATLPQPTEVSLTVEDGTAVAGEDYKAVEPFTVTIPAGSTSGEEPFTLTVIDDEGVEPDETIEIGGTATGFTVSSAEVTINDDDVAADEITLTVSPDTVTEGRAPQPFTVTASFPAGSATLPQPTEVSLTVEDGTAVAGEDYKAVEPFTVTIPAGSTSGEEPFTLTVIDDEGVEPDETIAVEGTAAGFTVSSAEVTINDDDVAVDEITLTVSPAEVDEGGAPQPFTVTASFPAGSATLPQPTEVSLTVEDGTAVAGEDYKAVEPFTVTIPAGSTSGEEPFTLTVIDDEGVEPDETIAVEGTAAGFTVSSAEVTINDDDVAVDEITLTVSPAEVDEGGAPQPFTVTASFPAGSATLPQPTEVSLTVEDGTAEAGEDYKAVEPFTVTIPAGSTSGEEPFTLTVIDDSEVEPDETIEIGGTAAGFTVSSAEVTINDDDVAALGSITVCPDPFTPNDDSFNDRVKFSIDGLEDPTLSIYTLEGVLIHTSDDLAVMDFRCNESPNSSSSTALFWDGRDDDGQDQPAGIYLFAIRDATSVVTAGRLTLAR